MLVARDWQKLPDSLQGGVIAIGNFDGVHIGHQAVIAEAKAQAERLGVPLIVMTFAPHPRRLFSPSSPNLMLMPFAEKLRALEALGVDGVLAIRFNKDFASLTAQDFVQRVLAGSCRAKHVVTGEDFVFGKNRVGDTVYLAQVGAEAGFTTSRMQPVMVVGAAASSTRIRQALAAGDMKNAATILGRNFSLQSRVRHGDKRGRTIGFPTANLSFPTRLLPAFGVYAVRAKMDGEHAWMQGVASLGINPTYPLSTPRLEVHLFDVNRDLYGQKMQVELLHYIRPELKFDDLPTLTAQIADDARTAREWFAIHAGEAAFSESKK